MKPKRSRARRHPQIHLPPLDAGYALTLVDIFERAIIAIWRAHGENMADLLQYRAAARDAGRGRTQEYVDDGNPDAHPDTPF